MDLLVLAAKDFATVQASAGFFPMLPADSFTWSDWQVLEVGLNTHVVSYLAIGPGPLGDVTGFYQSSTGPRRGQLEDALLQSGADSRSLIRSASRFV